MAAGAGAVILASVAFDIGHTTTTRDRAGELRAFVASLNTDIASCNSSLRDSFSAYQEVTAGRGDLRSTAVSIIRGDEPSCTPAGNTNLYDMVTTQAPATLRAFGVDAVTSDLSSWAFPQAAAAINDLATALANPGSTSAAAAGIDLRTRASTLTQLADSAQAVLDRTAVALSTSVARLDLGSAGSLRAGGF